MNDQSVVESIDSLELAMGRVRELSAAGVFVESVLKVSASKYLLSWTKTAAA